MKAEGHVCVQRMRACVLECDKVIKERVQDKGSVAGACVHALQKEDSQQVLVLVLFLPFFLDQAKRWHAAAALQRARAAVP